MTGGDTARGYAQTLCDIDSVIVRHTAAGLQMIRDGAPVVGVDAHTKFVRSLYGRRECVLNELKKLGYNERTAYEMLDARVAQTNGDRPADAGTRGENID